MEVFLEDMSEFISNSKAEKIGNTWTVYADGKNKVGKITQCEGSTEFEAKESAWDFLQSLKRQLDK